MADTRQRFQGKCFAASEGHKYMKSYYDLFPPPVRRLLMDAPFNLCTACVAREAPKYRGTPMERYIAAIKAMEEAILAELGPFGPQPVNPAPLVARPRRRHNVTQPDRIPDQ